MCIRMCILNVYICMCMHGNDVFVCVYLYITKAFDGQFTQATILKQTITFIIKVKLILIETKITKLWIPYCSIESFKKGTKPY
jgi:hypothetical protein